MMEIPLHRVSGIGRGSRDIGFSLALLVLVGILPVVAYSAGMAWLFVNHETAAVKAELAGTSRALTVAVDRELNSQVAAMGVLAADQSLDSGDSGDFSGFAERTRRVRAGHPEWLKATRSDPRSPAGVAAAGPMPDPVPATNAPMAGDEVVATGRPLVVGAFASGTITQRPVILLMAPVIRDGVVRTVMAVALDPAAVEGILAEQQLPAGWTGVVLDANLRVAGRLPQSGPYIGRAATVSQVTHIAAADRGLFEAFTQEGDPVYTVFSRSPASGWSVVIGIPAKSPLGKSH